MKIESLYSDNILNRLQVKEVTVVENEARNTTVL